TTWSRRSHDRHPTARRLCNRLLQALGRRDCSPRPNGLCNSLLQGIGGAAMSRLVLVTGGAGFIGSNLVRALLERGDRVRVLDNMSTGSAANLRGLDVEVVEGDLRSFERVATAVRGSEVVFHQGALPSVPRSIQDPLTS